MILAGLLVCIAIFPVFSQDVDGGFSDWSDFSSCTKTCGGGVQIKTRECNNPVPQNGGKDCVGNIMETRGCNGDLCPADGGFSDWSDFSSCTKTCGGGVQIKTRECDNPRPQSGGKDCIGNRMETRGCNNFICPDTSRGDLNTEVDGGFSDWSDFSNCTKSCGGGMQVRVCECNNPKPKNEGKDCAVTNIKTLECNIDICTAVDGGFSDWSDFSSCSKSCGGGVQIKQRECDNPKPQNGGKDCIGNVMETQECNKKSCPVDGGFSDWSDFSSCTKTCGGGVQIKTRECDNPKPQHEGKDCIGNKTETRDCNNDFCTVDGGFSDWSDFNSCTKTCGGGVQIKTRKCDKPKPQNGGNDCIGITFETSECNSDFCPVDGGFSDWSDFGFCTKSCGGGVQTKTRECNKPMPQNGGKDCIGIKMETQECNIMSCPVDGGFSDWSDYSSCTQTCGGGVHTKTRECNNPTPQNGGKDCDGSKTETQVCGVNPCAVDGGFSDWSDYSSCTQTCGGGVQTKTRKCDNPKPQNGGKDCIGLKMETRGCINDFCPGTDGIKEAQKLVEDVLSKFYVASNRGKPISGKSLKAIFEIQKAVAAEFTSVDPTSQKPVETLLKELEEFLVTAAKGGSIDFARVTLGKSFFNFMKKEIANGLPIDDIDEASKKYLEDLKTKIGEDKFSQIISSQGATTLMFVMDTTASMSDEINAAKGIAKAIIETSGQFPVDYILSPFNDPGLGPVIYKSETQRAEVINAITELPIYGGDDCPELAFGMLNAFSKGPQSSSPMFVFTDASAKDDSQSNIIALKAMAKTTFSPITFFANLNGCGSGIDSFKEIASYTSGQVFPLKDDKEIMSFTEYVKSSLQQDTVIASGEVSRGNRIKRQTLTSIDFFVDDGIKKLIVSVSTSVLNTANLIQLRFENGKLASPSTTTTMTQIYQISNSSNGPLIFHQVQEIINTAFKQFQVTL